MDDEQKSALSQDDDARFTSLLQELTRIKDAYVSQKLQWYRERVPSARRNFRFSSVLIIIFSVSIPFLTTLDSFWRSIVLPIVALMIAGLTGLSAFFRWENNWKSYTQAQLTLEHMLGLWELKISEATHELDPQKKIAIALQATEKLLNDTQGTIHTEAEEYFKHVQNPQTSKI